MSQDRVHVDTGPPRARGFLPVAVLAMALLLVAIVLAEDAVEPIDPPGDPASTFELDSDLEAAPDGGRMLPANDATSIPPVTRVPRIALGDEVPGFDGTVHLWVEDADGPALLIWPDQLAEPRRMDLPEGTRVVDMSVDRLHTAVASVNQDNRGVLWLGDRINVEPVEIFDDPISLRWSSSDAAVLAVSISRPDRTDLIVYRVDPGNVLVEVQRLELEAGRVVDWIGPGGVSLASLDSQPVGVWLTYDGSSTIYSRHLIQPGGRPIFDICTGVPCRPTVRMYAAPGGTFTEIPPEVVQVTDDERSLLALTARGPEVRLEDGVTIPVPMSGLNAWSGDARWMVFEQQGMVVSVSGSSTRRSSIVVHPLGFLDTESGELFVVEGPSLGVIEGIWLP